MALYPQAGLGQTFFNPQLANLDSMTPGQMFGTSGAAAAGAGPGSLGGAGLGTISALPTTPPPLASAAPAPSQPPSLNQRIQNGLGALFPVDPNAAKGMDPAYVQQMKNNAILKLGLGMVAAGRQPGASFGGALASGLGMASNDLNGAMQTAYQNARQARAEKRATDQEDRTLAAQAIPIAAQVAQKALVLPPEQRQDYVNQAAAMYKPTGVDISGLIGSSSSDEAGYEQHLRRVAAFAPHDALTSVAAGSTLYDPTTHAAVFTAPNPTQEEAARHNRAMEDRATPRTIITRPLSDGMVQDYLVDSRTGVRTPNGAPYSAADAKGQSGLGAREGVMFQRVVNSANSAATALQNIAELPVGASSGILGVGGGPGHSLMASAKNVLINKVASQDVQDYNVMLAGVSRNLSTLETAGLAPNGSITTSMDSIQLREGDTEVTKLRKLAEMRQIIEKNLEPNLSNPKVAPEQKDLVRQIIGQVTSAIPFTQHDLTELQNKQAKNPSFTLQDLISQKGLRPAGTKAPTETPHSVPPMTGGLGAPMLAPNGMQIYPNSQGAANPQNVAQRAASYY